MLQLQMPAAPEGYDLSCCLLCCSVGTLMWGVFFAETAGWFDDHLVSFGVNTNIPVE
jgi:hypothetical protein